MVHTVQRDCLLHLPDTTCGSYLDFKPARPWRQQNGQQAPVETIFDKVTQKQQELAQKIATDAIKSFGDWEQVCTLQALYRVNSCHHEHWYQ